MADDVLRHLYLGFIRLHILYHADKEPICGVELMEELGAHGYDVGPGTIYPVLHQMQGAGLLVATDGSRERQAAEELSGNRRRTEAARPGAHQAARAGRRSARRQRRPHESEVRDVKIASRPTAPAAVIIIRLMVGAVFISEGMQKFLFPADSRGGPIREDRHSVARGRRTPCWRVSRSAAERSCYWGSRRGWP